MRSILGSVAALLLSAGILVMGNGLQGTLLPVRAQLEHFSTPAIGLMGSFYFMGFGLGCVLGPQIIKRVGHIRAFAALAALAAAVPLVHAIFPHPWPWTFLRTVTGLCFAGLYTVIESWLNERSTNETRGRILSLYVVVNLFAIVCGQMLIGVGHPIGFQLFSLVAILVTLAVVPIALTTAMAPKLPTTVHLRLLRLYSLSPVGFVGCLIVGITNGAFWTLAPAFVTATTGTTDSVAFFMSVAVAGGALLQWPLGRLSDRFDRRWVIIVGCLAAAASGICLYLFGPVPLGLYLAAAGFGGTSLSMYALCVAHANDYVDPADAVETSSGLLLTFAAGAVVGPFLGSLAMQHLGHGSLFVYTACFHLLLAGFALYRMRRRATLPSDAKEPFVAVEPRLSAQVFELDPRAEPSDGGEPAEPAAGGAAGPERDAEGDAAAASH
ncbi:Predicted arabinose efflux permease, MFS family [Tistlia consotensis]|uniref:Predicted arabinose efflux permease, MFS family n=1 Tax=Tistlia consotensis USBA 355 TaxID=560819 RepID=A0A1Y6CPB0_9PROT|nr:MFS transporter [Tistlia consotensis]SMF63341.1 Predicted arabinose efflux permease, MFS family [Tistlia consotensis USBA 355]SNR96053.1 Predicted arabinose efflux permease, MFS family [Tistlia consotensis]